MNLGGIAESLKVVKGEELIKYVESALSYVLVMTHIYVVQLLYGLHFAGLS